MRRLRCDRHAVEDRCAGVVPTDAAGLAAGNGDRRRAVATPRQVRRLGAARRYCRVLSWLAGRISCGTRHLRAGFEVERSRIRWRRRWRSSRVCSLRRGGIAEIRRSGAAMAGCVRACRLSVDRITCTAIHYAGAARLRIVLGRRGCGLLASIASVGWRGRIANITRLGDRGRGRVTDVARFGRRRIADIAWIVTGSRRLRRRRTGWDWDDHRRRQHRGRTAAWG